METESKITRRKILSKSKEPEWDSDKKEGTSEEGTKEGTKPQTSCSRKGFMLMFGASIILAGFAYYRTQHPKTDSGTRTLVAATEVTNGRRWNLDCVSKDYENDTSRFPECEPKRCGRAVFDNIVSQDEVEALLRLALGGFSQASPLGGPSVMDLSSGVMSQGQLFVNLYKYMQLKGMKLFTKEDILIYREVAGRLKKAVASEFGLGDNKLFLTRPNLFSQITNKTSDRDHDKYWENHVDKFLFGRFYYTTLLYLADYGTEFTGGRFTFHDGDTISTVEPRRGRVLMFTAGSENPHSVEVVRSGTRQAIILPFTCNPEEGVVIPTLDQAIEKHKLR